MHVLIVHNRYRSGSPSGENQLVDQEIKLLEHNGVRVTPFIRESDSIAGQPLVRKLGTAVGPLYSPVAVRDFRRALSSSSVDLVHVHNVFPLIGPPVIRVAKDAGLPVVQTVHNYRLSCINGLHVRDGQRCDDCLGRRLPWPGVVHSCYRGSAAQSVPMAASQYFHLPTRRLVDRYLALTPFMQSRLTAAGIPADRITLRPTWSWDTGAPSPAEGNDVAFVGRLDEPKGIPLLLGAWAARRNLDKRLLIIGDGPLREEVRAAAERDRSIHYLGRRDSAGVLEAMLSVAIIIIPSVVYEGLPLTLVEAFSVARPVIVMSGSSPASLVDARSSWTSGLDARQLAAVLDGISPGEARRRGLAAREIYEEQFSHKAGLESLLRAYNSLLPSRAGAPRAEPTSL